MSLERLTFQDRESWLSGRGDGIGGSEAAAAVGMSPWQTPSGLWRLKMGAEASKDLSDNAAVQQGVRMEAPLREFFKALHPDFIVEYHQFDILYQSERPWLRATLDGEIIDRPTNRRGILEIKTATPSGKVGWEKWSNGQMPQYYFIQCLYQLLATGYDFVFLFAALYSMNGDITLREYEIQRADVQGDLAWLLEKEAAFWKCVETGALPPTPLTL